MKNLKLELFLAVTLFLAGTQFATAQVEEETEKTVDTKIEDDKENVEIKVIKTKEEAIEAQKVVDRETPKRLEGEAVKEEGPDLEDDIEDDLDDDDN